VRIDLHTHSTCSDGTDAPGEVVAKAARAGLDVVALTDHDTAAGWAEAEAAARAVGIEMVPGIEVSTRRQGIGVHLLAYLPDADDPDLARELTAVLAGREDRVGQVVRQLAAVGVVVDEEAIRAEASADTVLGRPHIADAMVRAGVVGSRKEAFARWLDPGRPGHVVRHAPSTDDAIRLVRAAGGVPVLAHPWARRSRRVLQRDDVAELATAGLAGLEVDHQMHPVDVREELRGIAAELDLLVTGSSDYHGTRKTDHDLGCNTTAPDVLKRIREEARR
jgi:predicted metal-dependent phosphoesterase TrpH